DLARLRAILVPLKIAWGLERSLRGAVRTRWRAPSSRLRSTTADRRSAPRQAPPARPVQRRHRRLGSEPTRWRLCGRTRGFDRLNDFEPFEFRVAECER